MGKHSFICALNVHRSDPPDCYHCSTQPLIAIFLHYNYGSFSKMAPRSDRLLWRCAKLYTPRARSPDMQMSYVDIMYSFSYFVFFSRFILLKSVVEILLHTLTKLQSPCNPSYYLIITLRLAKFIEISQPCLPPDPALCSQPTPFLWRSQLQQWLYVFTSDTVWPATCMPTTT